MVPLDCCHDICFINFRWYIKVGLESILFYGGLFFSILFSILLPLGSDGKEYQFLLKGHEDLRQDERVMQLFGLVNSLLRNNADTFRRNLTWVGLWYFCVAVLFKLHSSAHFCHKGIFKAIDQVLQRNGNENGNKNAFIFLNSLYTRESVIIGILIRITV